MASGMTLPAGKWHDTLAWAQVEQELMYLFTSADMDGHQYFPEISSCIHLVAGCPGGTSRCHVSAI